MIKILFELLKFLIDFEMKLDVSSKVNILKDFRWKRICYCRLCSYLSQIERNQEFLYVKLNKFLQFYEFPKSRPFSSNNGLDSNSSSSKQYPSKSELETDYQFSTQKSQQDNRIKSTYFL